MPIAAYADLSDFKLYMADVGLLTMKSGLAYQTVLSTIEQDNSFLGALAENYVAQQFKASQIPLYYWKNDNTAEVDFVLQLGTDIIPVEVKKGKRNKAIRDFTKAFRLRQQHQSRAALRDILHYKIENSGEKS